jgi:hypothetical protein
MTTHHYSEKTWKFYKTRSRFVIAMQSVSQSLLFLQDPCSRHSFVNNSLLGLCSLEVMRAPHAPPPPLPSRIRKTISAYECLVVVVVVCVCVREREREMIMSRCGFPYRATTTQNRHSCFPKAKSCTAIFFALGTLTSFGHTTLRVCAVVSVRGLFFPTSMTGILQCCTGISEQSGS